MRDIYQRTVTGSILVALVIITIFYTPPWGFALLMGLILAIILTTEWPRILNYKKPFFWLLTPFYPILPFALVIIMQLTGYQKLNAFIIGVVALFDTGSYLIGSLWGTRKINVLISPGKTWEGSIGGAFLTTALMLAYFYTKPIEQPFLPLIPFIVSLCFFALLGDLFESLLKRSAGVKDSGTVLPGHGGFLDRVDGMLFVALVVYCNKEYIQRLLS